jgi:predicted DNA-binding transcriptional regulator AlpA
MCLHAAGHGRRFQTRSVEPGSLECAMTPTTHQSGEALLRLPQVLQLFPVSRSEWYAGIKAGRYPVAIKLSERSVAWRRSDVDRLIQATIDRSITA